MYIWVIFDTLTLTGCHFQTVLSRLRLGLLFSSFQALSRHLLDLVVIKPLFLHLSQLGPFLLSRVLHELYLLHGQKRFIPIMIMIFYSAYSLLYQANNFYGLSKVEFNFGESYG